uniref:Uncharacterized protein n=1 Tax=Oryza brachyantha TaxID=4533 RepID=J3LNL7_ORYBR
MRIIVPVILRPRKQDNVNEASKELPDANLEIITGGGYNGKDIWLRRHNVLQMKLFKIQSS